MEKTLTIGVLAMQGGFREHIASLTKLGVKTKRVREAKDLQNLAGLIIPGGESTAIGKLLRETDLIKPLRQKITAGLPTWGTCAGLILLANEIEAETPYLDVIDIIVRRNAYGRQIDSFRTDLLIPEIDPQNKIPLVFIRAPFITGAGSKVKILATYNGRIIAARQNNILVTSFHPELTDDFRVHKYFLQICRKAVE